MVARVALVVVIAIATANAQPPGQALDASAQLRDANAAATAGDWNKVATIVDPLLRSQLTTADVAEAHRLAGLAFLFQGHKDLAEDELLKYLLVDPDGHLDPALYPPEALDALARVRSSHEAEILRARSAKTPQRSGLAARIVSILPVASQIQNRDYKKAIVFGTLITAAFTTDVITYVVLHDRWCKNGNTACDSDGGTTSKANVVRGVLVGSIVVGWATVGVAFAEGALRYERRRKREAIHAFATPVSSGAIVGISGTW